MAVTTWSRPAIYTAVRIGCVESLIGRIYHQPRCTTVAFHLTND